MTALIRTRTIYAGDSGLASSHSGSGLSSRDERGSVHSLRSIRTLSDYGWGDDLGAPLTRMGPQLMRLPRMAYLGPPSGGSGSYKSGTGSVGSDGAFSWGMTPLHRTGSEDGDEEDEADAAGGEEDDAEEGEGSNGHVFLVQLDNAALDPHSPEFANKLLTVMEGARPTHPERRTLGACSCTESDLDTDWEGEPDSPGHVGHLPDQDSVDEILARQEQYHWTDASGKPTWVHFRPSHLDDPPLHVKRLPLSSPEVALLRVLASERRRYHPDNPASEGLGLLVREGWAWVTVEEKKDVRGLFMGGSCGRSKRKDWGTEKANLMHQMLRYLTYLHSLCITCLDLSPENMLVTEHAYGNIYELLDFSTCYRFTASSTLAMRDEGKLVFDWPEGSRRAPELHAFLDEEGEREDANPFDVDVWALGKTFEEIDYSDTPLDVIVQQMTSEDPAERPSAGDALQLYWGLVGDG